MISPPRAGPTGADTKMRDGSYSVLLLSTNSAENIIILFAKIDAALSGFALTELNSEGAKGVGVW